MLTMREALTAVAIGPLMFFTVVLVFGCGDGIGGAALRVLVLVLIAAALSWWMSKGDK